MKSSKIVICDCDEDYAKALALFFVARKEVALQVKVCSTLAQAEMIEEEEEIDILLLAQDYDREERKKQKAKKIFLLCEKQNAEKNAAETALYKYQSGERILGEILKECEEIFVPGRPFGRQQAAGAEQVIGIFSPIHRIGKTLYALQLGEELAKTGNVLYLNLEVYGGVDGYFEEGEQTLTDLLYCARQEKQSLGLQLTLAVHHRRKLDYILPVSVSEDLKEVKACEWVSFIQRILEESIYETLVLDLDEAIPGVYELLKKCTQIHVPVLRGAKAAAKMKQFEQELSLLGMEEILPKIKHVSMDR